MTRLSYGQSERVIPLTKANDPDWCLDPGNLAELWRDLDRRGETPPDVAYYLEHPWKWGNEWLRMWEDRANG